MVAEGLRREIPRLLPAAAHGQPPFHLYLKRVLVRPDTVGGLLPEIDHPGINSGHHQKWQDAADLGSSVLIPRQDDVSRPLEDAGPSMISRV